MPRCCAEASLLETDGHRQVRTCGDLCSDSDFLLKVFALMFVCLGLLLPLYYQMTVYTHGMSPAMRADASNLFYTAALGALIALVVLVVLVVMDEERHYTEMFFLFVHSILLVTAASYIIVFVTYSDPPRFNSTRGDLKKLHGGSGTIDTYRKGDRTARVTATTAANTTEPYELEGDFRRHGDRAKREVPSGEPLDIDSQVAELMKDVFFTSFSRRAHKNRSRSSMVFLFPVLLMLAGFVMFIDFVLEYYCRTYV